MKITDLRKQSIKELSETIKKTEADLEKFRVDMRTKEVNNVRLGLNLRRQLAQAKTVLREKELSNGA